MLEKDDFLKKIHETEEKMTYPIAFNLLNRCIADNALESTKALEYRMELGKCTWQYLTEELRYDFSPAAYQAMRKILRSHMLWIMENCGDDTTVTDRANFYLALTAENPAQAKEHLNRISSNSAKELRTDCATLAQMIEEHQKACGD